MFDSRYAYDRSAIFSTIINQKASEAEHYFSRENDLCKFKAAIENATNAADWASDPLKKTSLLREVRRTLRALFF